MPVSIPDIPVACNGSVTPSRTPYTARCISTSSSSSSCNTGSRWPSIGWRIASSTDGSTLVGPGPHSSRSGGASGGAGGDVNEGMRGSYPDGERATQDGELRVVDSTVSNG